MTKLVATLGIVACLFGGCGTDRPDRAGPGPSVSTSASPSWAPPHDAEPEPTYTMPQNLCTAVSWTAFTDVYPGQPVRQMAELGRKDDPQRASTATCTAFVGSADDGLFLTIEARIYVQEALADEQYVTWRNLDAHRLADVKTVDAIGSAAYSMSDRVLGPALVVVHGNALFRFTVRDLGTAAHIPLGDPTPRLRTLATATIGGLPQTRASTAATWPPFGPQP